MRQRMRRWLVVLVVLGILLGGAAPPLFPPAAHASAARSHASLARPTFATAPTPSGAGNLFPLNPTFDAAVQTVGTPPANAGFETAPAAVGTPPANSNFSAASTVAGSPPQNNAFATGDFTGWTPSGGPEVAPLSWTLPC